MVIIWSMGMITPQDDPSSQRVWQIIWRQMSGLKSRTPTNQGDARPTRLLGMVGLCRIVFRNLSVPWIRWIMQKCPPLTSVEVSTRYLLWSLWYCAVCCIFHELRCDCCSSAFCRSLSTSTVSTLSLEAALASSWAGKFLRCFFLFLCAPMATRVCTWAYDPLPLFLAVCALFPEFTFREDEDWVSRYHRTINFAKHAIYSITNSVIFITTTFTCEAMIKCTSHCHPNAGDTQSSCGMFALNCPWTSRSECHSHSNDSFTQLVWSCCNVPRSMSVQWYIIAHTMRILSVLVVYNNFCRKRLQNI